MRFGRSSKSDPGRHRGAGEPQGADLTRDRELDGYLAAIGPSTDPEATDPGRRFGTAQVHQLRLSPGAAEQVQRLAEQRGTSPLALLQEWVLQRLDSELRR
ncbi:MAG: hypothetical protein M3R63_21270 [Actinomycetota bacterium]|nr:hypothetical protein [Actinomycetota bacterium]